MCYACKGKSKVDSNQLNHTSVDMILSKLDSISACIESRTMPQTVFFKARPGLGFNENENLSNSPQDKFVKELTEKVHSLDQYFHAYKENNVYLKEKVKVLEQSPKKGKTWYEGQPAHAIYKMLVKG